LDAIISTSTEARAQTVWRADRYFLFSGTGHTVLPYNRRGKLWISAGDPLGDAREFPDLISRFRAACTAEEAVPAFYSIGKQHHAIYRMLGFSLVKIAEDVWVDLHALNSRDALGALRDSAQFPLSQWALEVLLPAQAAAYREQFKELYVSGESGSAEMAPVAQNVVEFLARAPVAVLRDREGIVAFCGLAESKDRKELAMVAFYCDASAPDGVTEFLQLSLVERAKACGYHRFHLGQMLLAPEAMEPCVPLSFIEKRLYCRNGYQYGAQHMASWTRRLPLQYRARYLAHPPGIVVHQVLRAAAVLEQQRF
jgi:phosphatidylglycerol lysyltransferase